MDNLVKAALKAVMLETPSSGYSDYARTYAQAALNHPYSGGEMKNEELKVQLLYVLNNLQYWKGDRAKEVKAILRKAAK